MKPVIGIIAKRRNDPDLGEITYIRETMKQAIFDHGADAVGIIPVSDQRLPIKSGDPYQFNNLWIGSQNEQMRQQLGWCDGFILQGGVFSDKYEGMVAQYCYQNDIPLLGICAGHQVMAQALGGWLKQVDETNSHALKSTERHQLWLNPNSRLGAAGLPRQLAVNSSHTYCVVDPGPLKITAVAPRNSAEELEFNGDFANFDPQKYIIEGLEAPDRRFYVSVQFHPENLYREDEWMDRIFIAFLRACEQAAEEHD